MAAKQNNSSTKTTSGDLLPQLAIRFLVVTLALVSYANSSWGQFVFDDSEAILGNLDVDPSSTSLQQLFSHDFWGANISSNSSHKSYRPLTVLTFRLNFWLAGGLEPFGFHVANIVLHAVVSLLYLKLCTMICRRATLNRSSTTSALAALLFAVHPIHTESVSGSKWNLEGGLPVLQYLVTPVLGDPFNTKWETRIQ